jgi:hypothetical protein
MGRAAVLSQATHRPGLLRDFVVASPLQEGTLLERGNYLPYTTLEVRKNGLLYSVTTVSMATRAYAPGKHFLL